MIRWSDDQMNWRSWNQMIIWSYDHMIIWSYDHMIISSYVIKTLSSLQKTTSLTKPSFHIRACKWLLNFRHKKCHVPMSCKLNGIKNISKLCRCFVRAKRVVICRSSAYTHMVICGIVAIWQFPLNANTRSLRPLPCLADFFITVETLVSPRKPSQETTQEALGWHHWVLWCASFSSASLHGVSMSRLPFHPSQSWCGGTWTVRRILLVSKRRDLKAHGVDPKELSWQQPPPVLQFGSSVASFWR